MPRNSLAWLFGLEQFGIKLGLDNITAIADALGRPERSFAAVHVAGTNGKGSVSAMLDAGLRAAGHRTGLFTSPHLVDLRERFVIGGSMVDERALAETLGDVREVVEGLVERRDLTGPPTFFEVTTATAWELFRRAGVGIAVCEVGMGGRLDATNILRPRVCAITSIAFDHERHLGTTLAAIAAEKAGILKAGVPVVVGRLPGEARPVIRRAAEATGAPLVDAAADVRVVDNRHAASGSAGRLRIGTPVREYPDLTLALRGEHQIDNAAVAVRVLETLDAAGLNVPPAAVVQGLETARWPGRLDLRRLGDGREVLLDAAHNPAGAATLARYLRDSGAGPRVLVFAAARDKDIEGMLVELAPLVERLIATRSSNSRSEDPDAIAAIARRVAPELPVSVELDARDALHSAWRHAPSIVVAGSIFLLGDVITSLETS